MSVFLMQLTVPLPSGAGWARLEPVWGCWASKRPPFRVQVGKQELGTCVRMCVSTCMFVCVHMCARTAGGRRPLEHAGRMGAAQGLRFPVERACRQALGPQGSQAGSTGCPPTLGRAPATLPPSSWHWTEVPSSYSVPLVPSTEKA